MYTQNSSHRVETVPADAEPADLDDYASYEEGDFLVICDRTNAKAWIKSETLAAVEA